VTDTTSDIAAIRAALAEESGQWPMPNLYSRASDAIARLLDALEAAQKDAGRLRAICDSLELTKPIHSSMPHIYPAGRSDLSYTPTGFIAAIDAAMKDAP